MVCGDDDEGVFLRGELCRGGDRLLELERLAQGGAVLVQVMGAVDVAAWKGREQVTL